MSPSQSPGFALRTLCLLVALSLAGLCAGGLRAQNPGGTWAAAKKDGYGRLHALHRTVHPFVMYDSVSQERAGIEYDILEAFKDYARREHGVKLTIDYELASSFGALYNMIKNGRDGMVGFSAFSITPEREKEIQFTPSYMPGIETIIYSDKLPQIRTEADFKRIFRNKTFLYVPNTTFELNIPVIRRLLPDVKIAAVPSSEYIRLKVAASTDFFGYCELPTYLIANQQSMSVKRSPVGTVNRGGYALALPKNSDWGEAFRDFFLSPSFKPRVNAIIRKHLGQDVQDLVWDVAAMDSLTFAAELLILNRENEVQRLALARQSLELERQRLLTYLLLMGGVTALALAYMFFTRNRTKQRINAALTLKNREINDQKLHLERINAKLLEFNQIVKEQVKQITEQKAALETANADLARANDHVSSIAEKLTESLAYARRIQQAMLPGRERMLREAPAHFIFYEPCGIVSGDFYWFAVVDTPVGRLRYLAAVDCTGHGAPGAFMSIIGHNMLNDLVLSQGVHMPAEILSRLHAGVRRALKQDETDNRDGMDVALTALNLETGELYFAGAKLPIMYRQGGEWREIKGDVQAIGGLQMSKETHFAGHVIQLGAGDCFYLFSDGFASQFGGTGGRKFMGRPLRRLLQENADLPLAEQQARLAETLADWRGDRPQVDDVLVIGVRPG